MGKKKTIIEDELRTGADEPPVIDLCGIEGPERRRIGRRIAEACETWGFFQIINHGIEESLIKRTTEVFTQFFQLPKEEKVIIELNPVDTVNYLHQGYRRPRPDGHVLLNATEFLYNVYGTGIQAEIDRQPSQPSSFRSTVAEYVEKSDTLARDILGLMSEELGLPRETLPQLMAMAHSVRANYYQPSHGDEKTWSVPAHTDPSGITVLLSNELPGTQIKKDGRWVQINLVPGALLVNVADQIEILSNGRYKSVEHRGLPHETQRRLTVATFTSPEPSTIIGPLPELVDKSQSSTYKTQTFAAYFANFLRKGLDSRSVIQDAKLSTFSTTLPD